MKLSQTLKSLTISSVRKLKSLRTSVGGIRAFPRHPRRSAAPGPPDNTPQCVSTGREEAEWADVDVGQTFSEYSQQLMSRKGAGESRPLPESGRYHQDSSLNGFNSNVKQTDNTKSCCDPTLPPPHGHAPEESCVIFSSDFSSSGRT